MTAVRGFRTLRKSTPPSPTTNGWTGKEARGAPPARASPMGPRPEAAPWFFRPRFLDTRRVLDYIVRRDTNHKWIGLLNFMGGCARKPLRHEVGAPRGFVRSIIRCLVPAPGRNGYFETWGSGKYYSRFSFRTGPPILSRRLKAYLKRFNRLPDKHASGHSTRGRPRAGKHD